MVGKKKNTSYINLLLTTFLALRSSHVGIKKYTELRPRICTFYPQASIKLHAKSLIFNFAPMDPNLPATEEYDEDQDQV